MKPTAVVTVIVPGYDVTGYAADALNSLRAQTLAEWTAVLIDDGSTDGTGGLFEEAAARDRRFRVVRHDRRRGLGAARNSGLDAVETPFVAFLDGDDVMMPTALETMLGVLDASGSDFVAGAYVRLRPVEGGGYRPDPVQPWVSAATAPARTGVTIDEHPEAVANVVAWSKLSRTGFWHRTGLRFPEDRLYEDQVVAQLMYARARRFDVAPDVVVQWRERADGTSITQHEDRLSVLRDCLSAMADGMRVLAGTGHAEAAQARSRQLLRADIPRLARMGARHPDPEYRRLLGRFTREVWGSADGARTALDRDTAALVDAARLW